MSEKFETNNILEFLVWEIKCAFDKVNENLDILATLIHKDKVLEQGWKIPKEPE